MAYRILVSGIGGVLAAIGWLPPHSPIILICGIAIIFYFVSRSGSFGETLRVGFFGGLMFFLVVNRPLVSAYGWGGWSESNGMAVASGNWWLLNSLWVLISAWGALFWASVFCIYRGLLGQPIWLRVGTTIFAWFVIAEWLRAFSHWNFEWGFLGIALAEVDALRQWASVFGVSFLSLILLVPSLLLVEFVLGDNRRKKILLSIIGVTIGLFLWFFGAALRMDALEGLPVYRVAAFQYAPPVPRAGVTALGVSPDWFSAISTLAKKKYRLLVLPESISSHAVSFDGDRAESLGPKRQVLKGAWEAEFAYLLSEAPQTYVVVGTEGVEEKKVYNSTSVWNADGLLGWQHKVRLVPFAEYLPFGWGFLGSRALTYYRTGQDSLPIKAGPFMIGSFICQEIQHGAISRDLVMNGANILVTGGNDGVFSDSRVAQIHHSFARIRATETRRYLVRAMKTGVSSIVSPNGDVIGQSPGREATLIGAKVSLMNDQSMWVRFGHIPLIMLMLTGAVLAFFIVIFGKHRF